MNGIDLKRENSTKSIKQAAFHVLLKKGLAFVIVNFLIISFFVINLVYVLISRNEANLASTIISNIQEKNNRIKSISSTLAEIMSTDINQSEKSVFLEAYLEKEKDIIGILILNNDGIVVDTSKNYTESYGSDLSGRDFFNDVLTKKETRVSDPYVSFKDKRVTIDVVSPIIKNNAVQGMVVTTVNPQIIQNQNLDNMEYYIVNYNGDIIFYSQNKGVNFGDNVFDSKILDNVKKHNSRPLLYKDEVSGKWTLGVIREDPSNSTYVVVQNYIFDNKIIYNGLMIIFAFTVLVLFLFLFLLSAKIIDTVTNYINMFINQLKKITKGNYDLDIVKQNPYEEVNTVIEEFINMSQKVKQREEELQAFNEELIAANDEIKTMLSTINKNEKEKKEQYVQIIWTLLNLLEMKDEYTAGHSRSVTVYAETIAEALNKEYGFNIDLEKIQVAASLHDIGKIGISMDILNKPSKLTPEEFEIIKTHAAKGYYALENIKSLKEERKMIRHHHERYDGKGYPDGIKGDKIPLGARIICVADTFDAMVSNRPYRKGMPVEKAIDELIKNKGTQFDPLIVEVFIKILYELDMNVYSKMAVTNS